MTTARQHRPPGGLEEIPRARVRALETLRTMRDGRCPLLMTLALGLGLCACAGDGDPRGDETVVEERSRPRGPVAVESFSPEKQAFMKAGLRQFSRGDPAWETTRAEWLAMGRAEADFLVDTMWAALLRAQALSQPHLVEGARHELAKIGEPAIPLLADFLEGGTWGTTTDERSGERRELVVDDLARREASEILAVIGAPAVPAVRQALERSPSKAGRRWAIQTLGNIGERGGDAASAPLRDHLFGEDPVLRVEAAVALRHFRDAATRDALVAALGDGDDLVRRKAAESLSVRRERTAVAAIREAANRARAEARLGEAADLERAAVRIEQSSK